MTETIFAGKMPILALRGLCVFPEQTVHFEVGRSKSVKALEAAMQGDQTLLLIPQKDLLVDDPTLKDLYPVGCIAKVKQVLKTQGENLRILVTGISRGKITELSQGEPYLSGIVESASVEEPADTIRARALRREANSLYGVYLELCEHPAQTVQLRMLASESSGFIADSIAQNSGIDFPDKAKMLCQLNSVRRLETAVQLLRREVEMLRLEGDIQEKTRAAIDQNQKDYFLREQMKAIREELGEEDDEDEFDTYAQSIQNLHLEEETEKKLLKDVERLKKQPFGSSEGAVLRNYLDTVLELRHQLRGVDPILPPVPILALRGNQTLFLIKPQGFDAQTCGGTDFLSCHADHSLLEMWKISFRILIISWAPGALSRDGTKNDRKFAIPHPQIASTADLC